MTSALAPQSTARSHIGSVRLVNEDRILNANDRQLWAVADGMGGHAMGDVAADIVVDALAHLAHDDRPISLQAVESTLASANARILDLNKSGRQSGSTVAGLFLVDQRATIFWAGDSRVYRRRDGAVSLLTHDHRLVQEMIDAGVIDAMQARTHPNATVITRAIGACPVLELATRVEEVCAGDVYLICSDGLSDLLERRQLTDALSEISAAADKLLHLALSAGGTDNISLVIISIPHGATRAASIDASMTRF